LPVAVARGRMMGVSLTWLVGGQVVHGLLLLWISGWVVGGWMALLAEGGKTRNSREILKRRYRRLHGGMFWGFKSSPLSLDLENCPIEGGWAGGSGLAGAGSCFRGLRGRPDGGRRFAGSGGAQGRREESCMCFAALGCGWLTSGSRWMDHGWMQPVQCLRGSGRPSPPSRGPICVIWGGFSRSSPHCAGAHSTDLGPTRLWDRICGKGGGPLFGWAPVQLRCWSKKPCAIPLRRGGQ